MALRLEACEAVQGAHVMAFALFAVLVFALTAALLIIAWGVPEND